MRSRCHAQFCLVCKFMDLKDPVFFLRTSCNLLVLSLMFSLLNNGFAVMLAELKSNHVALTSKEKLFF